MFLLMTWIITSAALPSLQIHRAVILTTRISRIFGPYRYRYASTTATTQRLELVQGPCRPTQP